MKLKFKPVASVTILLGLVVTLLLEHQRARAAPELSELFVVTSLKPVTPQHLFGRRNNISYSINFEVGDMVFVVLRNSPFSHEIETALPRGKIRIWHDEDGNIYQLKQGEHLIVPFEKTRYIYTHGSGLGVLWPVLFSIFFVILWRFKRAVGV